MNHPKLITNSHFHKVNQQKEEMMIINKTRFSQISQTRRGIYNIYYLLIVSDPTKFQTFFIKDNLILQGIISDLFSILNKTPSHLNKKPSYLNLSQKYLSPNHCSKIRMLYCQIWYQKIIKTKMNINHHHKKNYPRLI